MTTAPQSPVSPLSETDNQAWLTAEQKVNLARQFQKHLETLVPFNRELSKDEKTSLFQLLATLVQRIFQSIPHFLTNHIDYWTTQVTNTFRNVLQISEPALATA